MNIVLEADTNLQHAYDDTYTLFQGKLQKHEAFEAEVAAHGNSIVSLNSTGDEMINANHFASSSIKVGGLYVVLLLVY